MIQTARLTLTLQTRADTSAIRAYRDRNAAHIAPWEPLRDANWDTDSAWQARVETVLREIEDGRSFPFVARRKGEADIVALATFSNVVRGVFQACHLGFSVDKTAEGTGLMSEALEAAIIHMFEAQGLHRIMANHLPENARSAALLARLGFEHEGYARDYLMIAGRWRDHVLTSRIAPQRI